MEVRTVPCRRRAAAAVVAGRVAGFEGATVPKDQAPATIPADSPVRASTSSP